MFVVTHLKRKLGTFNNKTVKGDLVAMIFRVRSWMNETVRIVQCTRLLYQECRFDFRMHDKTLVYVTILWVRFPLPDLKSRKINNYLTVKVIVYLPSLKCTYVCKYIWIIVDANSNFFFQLNIFLKCESVDRNIIRYQQTAVNWTIPGIKRKTYSIDLTSRLRLHYIDNVNTIQVVFTMHTNLCTAVIL